MKICLVSHEYPRDGGAWGGVGAYAFNMARALAEAGHGVFVIASGEADSREREEKVSVIRLPLNAQKVITRRTAAQVLEYSVRVAECVRALHGETGLDLVEFADFGAEGYSFITSGEREPAHALRLHTCLELVFRNDGRAWSGETRKMADMEITAIRAASSLTSPSAFLADLTAQITGIDAGAVRVLPNPVDTDFFRPSGAREETVVLCPGRLQMLKGAHVLVRAIPKILEESPEARFVFAGRDTMSGPGGTSYREHLESLLDGRGREAVRFVGEVLREEMARLYARAAVVATPSLYDNFPNTALEAMACGKAVVASRVGGIPEILRHGEGTLVAAENHEELARAISRYLGDGALRQAAGARARRAAVERFSSRVVAAEMTKAFEEMRGGARCASA